MIWTDQISLTGSIYSPGYSVKCTYFYASVFDDFIKFECLKF